MPKGHPSTASAPLLRAGLVVYMGDICSKIEGLVIAPFLKVMLEGLAVSTDVAQLHARPACMSNFKCHFQR